MTSAIADLIAPELPYLRRFARALTGTQESGDAYVVAMLEALVGDARTMRRDISPRVALYNAFLRVWNSVPMNQSAATVVAVSDEAADRRIETLTPRPRQAFLLAAVEEFDNEQIATITGATKEEVMGLIAEAGREIAEQIAAKVLIIEDEPLIALELEGLVGDIGHDVVGVARTRDEAVELANRSKPGLVLADIQLADGSSGIDAVNEILNSHSVPVVFITAYPERLLTGERAEPTFLIPKPFRQEMVKAVISQAMFFEVKAGKRL